MQNARQALNNLDTEFQSPRELVEVGHKQDTATRD